VVYGEGSQWHVSRLMEGFSFRYHPDSPYAEKVSCYASSSPSSCLIYLRMAIMVHLQSNKKKI
jgi:hypothetical protein